MIKVKSVLEVVFFMKRIITLRYLYRALLCALGTSLTLSVMTIPPSLISFIGVLYLSFFYFIFTLIFTVPIQFILNIKSKKINVLYLLFYTITAFIATAFGFMLIGGKPFIMISHYIFSVLAAIIFWLFDSILLKQIN